MIGRLFILSAFPAMWWNGSISFLGSVCWAIVVSVFFLVVDSGRGIRTLPSTIMARFMFGICLSVSTVMYVFMNHAAGRTYWTLADCLVVPFWITVIVTALFWSFAWIGTLMVRNDPDYQEWVAAGGHYFFDLLPRTLNDDSDLIRNGGFAEPTYTSFVPPKTWRHQCPQCGARVQHTVDVCWNCNYGSDGDSAAYFERYGNQS